MKFSIKNTSTVVVYNSVRKFISDGTGQPARPSRRDASPDDGRQSFQNQIPMKKVILTLTALASLTVINTSKAAIGWTLNECLAHWGPITQCVRDEDRFLFDFSYKGYTIGVLFLHDKVSHKVSRVGYAKFDSDYKTLGLSFEEIGRLLETNGPGKFWAGPVKDEASNSVRYTWKTDDGLVGVYNNNILCIFTDEDNNLTVQRQSKEASDL
jgi:hypothetical protein